MKLSQKIKHIKRHRKNKKLYNSAEIIYMIALRTELPEAWQNMLSFCVSPLMYEIMRVNHTHVPGNITHSSLMKKDVFLTTEREKCDMLNVEYPSLRGCDIPLFNTQTMYMALRPSVSAPAPDVCTLNGVRV